MVKNTRYIKRAIRQYVAALKQRRINVEKVILFGSYASGRLHQYSDIDLSVISRDFERKNILKRQEVLGLSTMGIDAPIEAIGYSPREIRKAEAGTLLYEILKTGKVVYRHSSRLVSN